ncbi:hypothetical protein AMATHDRAFT_68223 [Amanita thiersii Skay4041]|uniref:Uncharacterized protein n=1 Tax=Amanita thiersii Skay4041 TaxID=703135 RepID=A0A2A9NG23_9AGAR|nr:hypothetical protein AMATHDRAFT_68223 [Amanita thiersii Skay4041]
MRPNLSCILLWSGVLIAISSAAPAGLSSEGESDLALRDIDGHIGLSTRDLYDVPYEYLERDLVDYGDGLYQRELYDGGEVLYERDGKDESELVRRGGKVKKGNAKQKQKHPETEKGCKEKETKGNEKVIECSSYEEAAMEACKFVNGGSEKINPAKLDLYQGRLKASPGHGQIVGLGYKSAAGNVVPFIRLDMDSTGKAVHFNAVQLSDSSKKLAAIIRDTVPKSVKSRERFYKERLKKLKIRSARGIWNWWSTGNSNHF